MESRATKPGAQRLRASSVLAVCDGLVPVELGASDPARHLELAGAGAKLLVHELPDRLPEHRVLTDIRVVGTITKGWWRTGPR